MTRSVRTARPTPPPPVPERMRIVQCAQRRRSALRQRAGQPGLGCTSCRYPARIAATVDRGVSTVTVPERVGEDAP